MDAKYLIACHCGATHNELFLYKYGKDPISLKSDLLKNNVEYIDTSPTACSDPETLNDWKPIPPQSKDYIFSIFCPLRTGREEITKNLFTDGLKILKPGGKLELLIPSTWAPDLLERYKNLPGWGRPEHVEIVDNPVSVYAPLSNMQNYSFIILTKPSGGKRKKTRRSKKKRSTRRR